jgi:hypothetical protein
MKLTAVVSSASHVHWTSCRSIGADLLRAYSGLNDTKAFFLEGESPKSLLQTARAVYDAGPSALVYLDHTPHPALFLAALSEVYGERARPSVYVHVYGDFTLRIPGWIAAGEWLERFSIQWICASHRHARFVGNFLKRPRGTLEV